MPHSLYCGTWGLEMVNHAGLSFFFFVLSNVHSSSIWVSGSNQALKSITKTDIHTKFFMNEKYYFLLFFFKCKHKVSLSPIVYLKNFPSSLSPWIKTKSITSVLYMILDKSFTLNYLFHFLPFIVTHLVTGNDRLTVSYWPFLSFTYVIKKDY